MALELVYTLSLHSDWAPNAQGGDMDGVGVCRILADIQPRLRPLHGPAGDRGARGGAESSTPSASPSPLRISCATRPWTATGAKGEAAPAAQRSSVDSVMARSQQVPSLTASG